MNRNEVKVSIDRRAALAGIAASALGGLSAPVLAQSTRGVTSTAIKVGATLALSGPVAVAHGHFRVGQDVYVRMINDRGGVNGRKIDLIFEDHEFSAQKSVLAVRKLVTRDGIFALVGSSGSAHLNPVLPFLAEQGVPVINSFAGELNWFAPTRPGVYGIYSSNEYVAQALGRWAAKDGHRKILVPYFDAAYFRTYLEYVLTGARSVNPNVEVEWMPIKLGTVDYLPHALEIIRRKPDAVIGCTIVAEFASMVRELRNQGSRLPVYTIPANVFESLLSANAAPMEGIKGFAFTTSPFADTPAVREYREAMAKYAPKETPDFMSLFTFAGAKVFVEALSRIKGEVTHDALYRSLESLQGYDSGILPPVTFSSTNHQGTNSLFKVVAKNGRWTPTGEIVDAGRNTW